jgi:hypothetical protein
MGSNRLQKWRNDGIGREKRKNWKGKSASKEEGKEKENKVAKTVYKEE